jgi:RNase adapter protein RapZ
LAIGFGCTGGKHRSVTMVEMLQKELQLRGWHVTIRHRELLAQAAPSDTSDSKVLSS